MLAQTLVVKGVDDVTADYQTVFGRSSSLSSSSLFKNIGSSPAELGTEEEEGGGVQEVKLELRFSMFLLHVSAGQVLQQGALQQPEEKKRLRLQQRAPEEALLGARLCDLNGPASSRRVTVVHLPVESGHDVSAERHEGLLHVDAGLRAGFQKLDPTIDGQLLSSLLGHLSLVVHVTLVSQNHSLHV